MLCEEHPVDALLRMESFKRKILACNRTWPGYPNTLVHANFCNSLPREYDFQKQLPKSREGDVTREAIITVIRDWYESPEFEPFRKKRKKTSEDQAFMASGMNSRHGGGPDGDGEGGQGEGENDDGGHNNSGGGSAGGRGAAGARG